MHKLSTFDLNSAISIDQVGLIIEQTDTIRNTLIRSLWGLFPRVRISSR